MKTIFLAVLATMLIAGTAVAQDEETSFRDALTENTVSQAKVSAAIENASLNGFDGISTQLVEQEVGDALDRWQSLVVESCATDWATVIEVQWMVLMAVIREQGSPEGEALLVGLESIAGLADYYQTNATIACEL